MSNINLDLNQILEDQKASLKETAIEQLRKSVSENITWNLSHAIQAASKKFIEAEIIPEITTLLEANKEDILKQLSGIANSLGKEIEKALVQQAVKNLQNSWTVGEIGKKLFG